MSATKVVLAGRRLAESLMTDVVVIRRKSGETVDPDTLEVLPSYELLYEGPGKVQTYEAYERTPEADAGQVTVQRSACHIPVGALEVHVGDVVTVMSSPADPLLAGRSFRVTQHYPVKTHMTAYRVFVDENVGEEVPPWQAP